LIKKDKYKTGDVLKISVPEQKVLTHYAFEAGNMVMLIGGKHIGEIAPITNYEEIKSPKPNIVYFEGFSTIKSHVFMVGHDKPEITVPDVIIMDDSNKVTLKSEPEKTKQD
jgi:ribosomal protein S4E